MPAGTAFQRREKQAKSRNSRYHENKGTNANFGPLSLCFVALKGKKKYRVCLCVEQTHETRESLLSEPKSELYVIFQTYTMNYFCKSS